jgi:plasmid stabilization system protein ParE
VKIVWTDQAYLRLAEIEDFVARDRPEAAERLVARLIDRADVLAHQPSLGRALPELPHSGLRELVEGNYRIVYRLREGEVEILTVFEGHRRLPVDDLP